MSPIVLPGRWPGRLCLDAAVKYDVELITRVVDHGGLFHDDVKPGHTFGPRDHRTFRPQGWVENGNTKIEAMRRSLADRIASAASASTMASAAPA